MGSGEHGEKSCGGRRCATPRRPARGTRARAARAMVGLVLAAAPLAGAGCNSILGNDDHPLAQPAAPGPDASTSASDGAASPDGSLNADGSVSPDALPEATVDAAPKADAGPSLDALPE